MERAAGVVLIFGGTGAIGDGIARRFQAEQWRVVRTTRGASPAGMLPEQADLVRVDPFGADTGLDALTGFGPFDSVCWAQGININDSVLEFDARRHLGVYQANCLFVLSTLSWLVQRSLVSAGGRLCVVSSVWQELARQNKLSYCVSKAALQGLVLSASVDLAPHGIRVNAVLPGPLDTPMTRQALSPEQIRRLEAASPFGRLATVAEVADAVYALCSPANTGMSGQFVHVDSGFSYARLV